MKMEGMAIEKFEGSLGRSERHVGIVRTLQHGVDLSSVGAQSAAKAVGMPEHVAGATSYGRVVGSSGVVVEKWVLGEKREPQGGKGRADEIDDDDLGCGQKAEKLVGGHRFFAGAGLGFGVCAKTSRKSFSSRRASSRSAATASNSSPRFMRTR